MKTKKDEYPTDALKQISRLLLSISRSIVVAQAFYRLHFHKCEQQNPQNASETFENLYEYEIMEVESTELIALDSKINRNGAGEVFQNFHPCRPWPSG